jgi:hypothetical protein
MLRPVHKSPDFFLFRIAKTLSIYFEHEVIPKFSNARRAPPAALATLVGIRNDLKISEIFFECPKLSLSMNMLSGVG